MSRKLRITILYEFEDDIDEDDLFSIKEIVADNLPSLFEDGLGATTCEIEKTELVET